MVNATFQMARRYGFELVHAQHRQIENAFVVNRIFTANHTVRLSLRILLEL